MAEKSEARASVHLPLDHLRFGVHSFCASVVEWVVRLALSEPFRVTICDSG